jgi:L-arabinose isomerase
VLSNTLDTEAFADLAEIAGIELVVIDARTTVRDLGRELGWSDAHYRLSRSL